LSDLELDVEDTAEIGLQFANGVLGSLHLDYNQQPPSHRLEIIGTQGTIRWDNALSMVELYRNTQMLNLERLTFKVPENFERNDLFRAEMEHFLAVARGEARPVCTFEDGIAALRLAMAVYQSAKTGKRIHLS
jgi:predicted dehydrogenase